LQRSRCSPAPLGRRSPPNTEYLACLARWRFASATAQFRSAVAPKVLAHLRQSQGASRVTESSIRAPLAGRSSARASGLACARRSRPSPATPSRRPVARARARQRAMAGSVRLLVARHTGASAVAVQVCVCRVAALPGTKRCCLTLRWSGRPPASQLGREALAVYHPPRGQAGLPAPAPQLKR